MTDKHDSHRGRRVYVTIAIVALTLMLIQAAGWYILYHHVNSQYSHLSEQVQFATLSHHMTNVIDAMLIWQRYHYHTG